MSSGSRSSRPRTLLKGFSVDNKSSIEEVKKALISFLQAQYLKDDCGDLLLVVFYAELRGKQRYLSDIYVDRDPDIDFVVRTLNNPRYIRPKEKFAVVIYLERSTTQKTKRRV